MFSAIIKQILLFSKKCDEQVMVGLSSDYVMSTIVAMLLDTNSVVAL